MKRILSALIITIIIIGIIPVYVSAAYENTYSNTGNQRVDIVEVAKTQIGNTNGLKYRPDGASWCASFVVWCARQAGIDSSIIKNTGWATADDLGVMYKGRNADRSEGINYTPQSGDLIIFDWSSNGYCYKSPASNYGDHVGIVEYVSGGYVHTIEGNSGSSPRSVKRQTYSLNSSEIKGYGIPNYKSNHTHSYISNYEAAHPHKVYKKCSCGDWYYTGDTKYLDSCSDCWDKNRVDVWASRVNETTELSEGIVKNRYQFWFKFANKDTGALYNSYGSIRGYKSKISVYNPDGSELYSYTYDDSDYNWIRAIPEKIGKYKIEIVLTGNITAKYSEYFEVKSDAQITFDTGHLIMVKGQSKSFYAKATGNWPKNSYLKESINTNIATAKRDGHTITITAVKPGITFYSLKIIDPEGNVLTEKRIMIKVSPDVYKVTYYANGGSGAPMEQEKKYGVNLTLSSTVPLRNGYVFTGWNTKEDGSGKKYSPGDIYSENEKLNLYAQWKTNAYTLTYDGNGYSSYSSKVENVVTTTIKTNMPNRFGYTFLGWSTNSSATSASYTPGNTISLSSNTTLYAVWKSAQSVSAGSILT